MTVEELVLLIDLLDKLGFNTETAGTGTVFQRLAQIADYVDTLESVLGTVNTKVGTNTDAAGTGTLFARLAQIAGYTDAVESLIGAANPTTGGTNTLFNYLKKIFDASLGKGTLNIFYLTSTTDATQTLCNIAGSGVLLTFNIPYNSSGSVDAKFTVDGSVRYNGKIGSRGGGNADVGATVISGPIRFETGLIIEVTTINVSRVDFLACVLTGV